MFAAELEALGIWWPDGDGDALRIAADGWAATADIVEDLASVLDVAAAMVTEHHTGEAAARFASVWSLWTGAAGYLATTVADCRRIAAALVDFGTDIDVADRALLRLIEDALDSQRTTTLSLIDEIWSAWLADGATGIAATLDTRVDTATAALGAVNAIGPVASADDRLAIDPTQVAWPDLGRPVDLSHLATSPVDLGAGEGDLSPITAPPATPGTPGPDGSVPPGTGAPGSGLFGSGISIVVNGDGNTITIESPQVPTWQPPEFDPPADLPFEPEPDTSAPFEPFTPAPWTGPPVDPLEPMAYVPPAYDPPAEFPPAEFPPANHVAGADDPPVPPTVPIVVDPPGRNAAALGAAGATAAAAAARSGRAPFFPFMPMGGAMSSGDEAPEPKRRSTRRRQPAG